MEVIKHIVQQTCHMCECALNILFNFYLNYEHFVVS